MVGGRGFETKLKNSKSSTKKGASRPAGEGTYAIVSHRGHTHLLYSLELLQVLGEVQKSFEIKTEADYVFLNRSIENSPSSIDVPFSNFSSVSINNLNQRGTEVLLIGVGADIGRLGIKADADRETLQSADVFQKLKANHNRHPIKSLITGNWI